MFEEVNKIFEALPDKKSTSLHNFDIIFVVGKYVWLLEVTVKLNSKKYCESRLLGAVGNGKSVHYHM